MSQVRRFVRRVSKGLLWWTLVSSKLLYELHVKRIVEVMEKNFGIMETRRMSAAMGGVQHA